MRVLRFPRSRGLAPTTSSLLPKQRVAGSGVVLNPSGLIVTNAHVVGGAQRVSVLLPAPGLRRRSLERSILRKGGRELRARLLGLDHETDIALLKVEASGLPSLQLVNDQQSR